MAPSPLPVLTALALILAPASALAESGDWTVSAGATATSLNGGVGPVAELQQDLSDRVALEARFGTTFPGTGTDRYLSLQLGLDTSPLVPSTPGTARVHGRPHAFLTPGVDYARDYVDTTQRFGLLGTVGIGYALTFGGRVVVDPTVAVGTSIRVAGRQDPATDIVGIVQGGLTVGVRI